MRKSGINNNSISFKFLFAFKGDQKQLHFGAMMVQIQICHVFYTKTQKFGFILAAAFMPRPNRNPNNYQYDLFQTIFILYLTPKTELFWSLDSFMGNSLAVFPLTRKLSKLKLEK